MFICSVSFLQYSHFHVDLCKLYCMISVYLHCVISAVCNILILIYQLIAWALDHMSERCGSIQQGLGGGGGWVDVKIA